MPEPTLSTAQSQNETLRLEFNKWAEQGKGSGMEKEHLPIVLPMLAKMQLHPDENVLDVGCGSGWLCRMLAGPLTEGRVVGMDVSDEMIRLARKACADLPNAMFVTGAAAEIPWQPNFFSHVISVESSYYWPDPAAGVRDVERVLHPGGSFWNLINYYADNPYCHQWGALLAIPAKLLSAAEWSDLYRAAGLTDVITERIPDPTPTPEVYTGKWFKDAAELEAFRKEGALLVRGTKP